MAILAISQCLSLILKTYTNSINLRIPTPEIIRIWIKYYGSSVNTENIKYLMEKHKILQQKTCFHHDGSSFGAVQCTSMCITYKNIKNVSNHNENIHDEINENEEKQSEIKKDKNDECEIEMKIKK